MQCGRWAAGFDQTDHAVRVRTPSVGGAKLLVMCDVADGPERSSSLDRIACVRCLPARHRRDACCTVVDRSMVPFSYCKALVD